VFDGGYRREHTEPAEPAEPAEPTALLKETIEALAQIKKLSTPLNTLPWEKQEPLDTNQMAHLLDEISSISSKPLLI